MFGHSKTWRGLLASLTLTPLLSLIIGINPYHGFIIAVFAMSGDLISSFIKRRIDIPSSGKATILDQFPESVLPYLYLYIQNEISFFYFILGNIVFLLTDIFFSKILYLYGIRKRPY